VADEPRSVRLPRPLLVAVVVVGVLIVVAVVVATVRLAWLDYGP